jgi:hypothetical protein
MVSHVNDAGAVSAASFIDWHTQILFNQCRRFWQLAHDAQWLT